MTMASYVTKAELGEATKKLNDRITSLVERVNAVEAGEQVDDSAIEALRVEDQALREAIEKLGGSAPAPSPEPEPAPPTKVPKPWESGGEIATSSVLGEVGKIYTLERPLYEGVLFRGEIKVPAGAELVDCRFLGPQGLKDAGASLLYILSGKVRTRRCEFTGSEGRSAIYQHGGVWTPEDVWVHGNGGGAAIAKPEYQQVYVGAGEIVGGKGGLIEDGPDYGFQAYNSPGGTDKVPHIDWDGLQVRNCRHGCLVLSHRVSDAVFTDVTLDGTGAEYGVLAYNLEGTGNSVSGRVWGAKKNIAQTGAGAIDTSALLAQA